MAPDLSEKFLGIDIDDADDRTHQDSGGTDDDEEELEQFLFFEVGETRLAVSVEAVHTLADAPDDVTRVPRAPPAIDGMVDLRGEITAVVDPRVHFPETESVERPDDEQLLVLDRTADQQSAAIRVDGVIGVETVLERNVLDEAAVEGRALSGDALEHPLVVGIVEQRRETEPDLGGFVAATARTDAASDVGADASGAAAVSSSGGRIGEGDGDSMGTPFALDSDETETEPDDSDETREVVVTGTPLLSVDKLLLASGYHG